MTDNTELEQVKETISVERLEAMSAWEPIDGVTSVWYMVIYPLFAEMKIMARELLRFRERYPHDWR